MPAAVIKVFKRTDIVPYNPNEFEDWKQQIIFLLKKIQKRE